MAKPNDGNIVKRTSQYIDNKGFDETTDLPGVELLGTDGTNDVNGLPNVYRAGVTSGGKIMAQAFSALVPSQYDYISFVPSTNNPTSIVFKNGGSSGTVVATLTLAYSGSDITSITKS